MEPKDHTSQEVSLPYRDCVGVVVFNKEGKVFAGRRLIKNKTPYELDKKLWQFPQGGIDEGEDALAAAYRELYEETGIKSVRLLAVIDEWLYYDLPKELLGIALNGCYKGQRQKWFAFAFLGEENEIQINPPPENYNTEFDQWGFFDLEKIAADVIPFKAGIYQRLVQEFAKFSKNNITIT